MALHPTARAWRPSLPVSLTLIMRKFLVFKGKLMFRYESAIWKKCREKGRGSYIKKFCIPFSLGMFFLFIINQIKSDDLQVYLWPIAPLLILLCGYLCASLSWKFAERRYIEDKKKK